MRKKAKRMVDASDLLARAEAFGKAHGVSQQQVSTMIGGSASFLSSAKGDGKAALVYLYAFNWASLMFHMAPDRQIEELEPVCRNAKNLDRLIGSRGRRPGAMS